ncbi:hypothetical protein SK854_05900 [Lentzea sp. BCCO 10_0061]|uniref:Uncharacterized protein n=1 Tax=Lentzea sokolovensis TaxID=3095429 RepID=A0ABU4USE0_9PSEU|nr:hypothetical protein [Lentzea sp. BCCO 10_0061]MDX8141635.1 hypothetical protein [Lentzea sp. BCCO 10_0061]
MDLAKLLVPRGVPAELIEYQAFFGVHWGEEPDRLATLVEQFESLADSADVLVAAVVPAKGGLPGGAAVLADQAGADSSRISAASVGTEGSR